MLTQACIPLLNHANHSSIVFTLDDKNTAYWGAYSAAKAGLHAFMEVLADELESTSIKINGLIPGAVKTSFRTRAFPAENQSTLKQPEDVAQAACYLLNNTKAINGENSHGKTFHLDELLALINENVIT